MTDVRVHDDYRIGAEGEGWRAALTTLMNERTAIGGSGGGSVVRAWRRCNRRPHRHLGEGPEWVRTPQNRDDVMKLWIKAEASASPTCGHRRPRRPAIRALKAPSASR